MESSPVEQGEEEAAGSCEPAVRNYVAFNDEPVVIDDEEDYLLRLPAMANTNEMEVQQAEGAGKKKGHYSKCVWDAHQSRRSSSFYFVEIPNNCVE